VSQLNLNNRTSAKNIAINDLRETQTVLISQNQEKRQKGSVKPKPKKSRNKSRIVTESSEDNIMGNIKLVEKAP
jgi:hypothetical protein